MKRAKLIDVKGKNVLMIDFSDCSTSEAITAFDEAQNLIKEQPEGVKRVLVVLRNSKIDLRVLRKSREFSATYERQIQKAAVVGAMVFSRIGNETVLFNNLAKAKDWLVGS